MTAETRWARQERLLGAPGQDRLRAAHVGVVGCGGLGSPAILYLAAAGVGHLTLVDFDEVALSNLNRQVLHRDADLGRAKVERAAEAVAALDPQVRVTALRRVIGPGDAEPLTGCDVVLDCTDSFASRAAVAGACRAAGVPEVWGVVDGWTGMWTAVAPGGPTMDRLFPDAAATAPPGPPQVLGATAGVVGAAMASAAVRVLLDGVPAEPRLVTVDLRRGQWREVPLSPDEARR